MKRAIEWAMTMLAAASVAAGAGDMEAAPAAAYEDAMAAGRRILTWKPPGSALNRPKIDFAAAGIRFRQAAALARTDPERAAALLDLADSRLHDYRETDTAAIRADYERVLALPGAGALEKAQAALGAGETCVREGDYERGYALFADARALSDHWTIGHQVQYALAFSRLRQRRLDDARREFERLLDMERLSDPQAWRARAMLLGLERVPRIRWDHPRMFFNADTWPAVKARALGTRRPDFDLMQSRVARLHDTDLESKDWGAEAMDAAFVYRVTGDPAALEKARRLMRASVDFYLGRSVFRGRMYTLAACAAALDWTWNDLSAPEREALAQDLIRYADALDVEDQIQESGVRGMLHPTDYYIRSVPWYFGLASFSEDLDDVSYGRAFTALSRGFLQYSGFRQQALEQGGDDGAVSTMLGYYFAETLTPLWLYCYCWESAMGEPVVPELAGFLSPDYVLRNMIGLNPGYIVNFNYGKTFAAARGMRGDLLYDHLGQMIRFFGAAHPEPMALARHLQQRMKLANVTGLGEFSIYPFLRDPDPDTPAPPPPANLPVARHFEHVGQVLMSSGFGPSDTYALFSCGNNRDYGQYDSTHFTIYKQGYLALDSGTLAQGIFVTPESSSGHYFLQTVAHNCVLIQMDGETVFGSIPNYGGQCRSPSDAALLAFESRGRDYAYVATDATPVYHPDKCARMVRQCVYLPPDHFVVFDRVTATRPEYAKTWLLHTANEPVVAGKEFRADQGQGRLFCRTLRPSDATLEAIGGPGREFWAGGRNWPMPTNAPVHAIHTDRLDHIPESIGRWRVEVTPGAAREHDGFLHLIQTSDQTVEHMTDNWVRETEDWIRIGWNVGPRTIETTFNKTGPVGGHIRIAENGVVLVDRPLTRAIMPQAGLALESGAEHD